MIFYYLIVLFSAVPNHPWFGSDVGGVTVFKLVGSVGVVYALGYLVSRGSSPGYLSTWPARFYVCLNLIALASYLVGKIMGTMWASPLQIYISCFLLFLIMVTVVDSFERLRWSILSLVGALGLASLYTLREWQVAGFSYYRPGYVAGDANFFSAAVLLAIPLAYYLYREKGPKWERLFCLGCLLLMVMAFVSASSRGGLVGLALGMVYGFLRSEKKLGFGILILIVVGVIAISPMSPIKRIMNPDYGDNQSVMVHKMLWSIGLEAIQEHPLVGIGLGNFWMRATRQKLGGEIFLMAHNTYLEYAAELGIPAAVVFLGLLFSTLLLLERVRRRSAQLGNSYMKSIAQGMQAGLVGFSGAAFFISAEYEKPLWIVIFLSVCMPRILEASTVEKRRPVEVTAGSPVVLEPSLQPLEEARRFATGRSRAFRVERPKLGRYSR